MPSKSSKNNRLWRRVVEYVLHLGGGNSPFANQVKLGNVYELTLECGHKTLYQPRYKDNPNAKGIGWTRRRDSEDALPPPKKVICKRCESDQRRKQYQQAGG